jgi:threonine/homoserine/homoserine lactone efflux protein
MLPDHNLAGFLLATVVLVAVPGPSVTFIVSRGVALGRRAAVVTVLGNSAGLVLQLLLVGVGLGDSIARSHTALEIVTLFGAGYLLVLGWRTIGDRRAGAQLPGDSPPAEPLARVVREGFIVGSTNPKGLVMFSAVLPRFVDRHEGGITAQLLTLGAIVVAIGFVTDGAWAVAASAASRWLAQARRRGERLRIVSGGALIVLGTGLAVTAVTTNSLAALSARREVAIPAPLSLGRKASARPSTRLYHPARADEALARDGARSDAPERGAGMGRGRRSARSPRVVSLRGQHPHRRVVRL